MVEIFNNCLLIWLLHLIPQIKVHFSSLKLLPHRNEWGLSLRSPHTLGEIFCKFMILLWLRRHIFAEASRGLCSGGDCDRLMMTEVLTYQQVTDLPLNLRQSTPFKVAKIIIFHPSVLWIHIIIFVLINHKVLKDTYRYTS